MKCNGRVLRIAGALLVTCGGLQQLASADDAQAFFEADAVQEIRLVFDDPNWYDTLYAAHARDPEDPYFPARFEYGDVVLDPVGVRFKGNSSFGSATGVKKSFKIDFNEYDEGTENEDTTFFGLKKLNLNNSFKDPTMLREKLFLDFVRQYGPALRAVHVRVVVNGEYWGLYTAVEQLDKTFIRDRFGGDEDGNLYEGEAGDGGAPQSAFGSDLTWQGSDPQDYMQSYQLKTNESENDWSGFVAFVDILNNAAVEELPQLLEPVFDVDSWLMSLAQDMLFVNLDSYVGSAHNYYLYDRDDTGCLTYLHWDCNEAFGSFRYGMAPGDDPLELDPFWTPRSQQGQGQSQRPLMERLWQVESYERTYLRDLARMLREGFDEATLSAQVNELADRIRSDVYADDKKQYSNQEFERGLTSDLGSNQGAVYGLLHFVQARAEALDDMLDELARPADIRCNELMSVNLAVHADSSGDFDPWLELYNLGPGRVDLSQLYLTDTDAAPTKWTLPAVDLEDGGYLVVWLDGEGSEGADHAPFALAPGGGELLLYSGSPSSPQLVDTVTYPALDADVSYDRLPDGEGVWVRSDQPTPAAANLVSSQLPSVVINELMADNDTTIADPEGNGGYPDWFELYNTGGVEVELGGMYLSDDLDEPTMWRIPDGVTIPAHGYLLFWADNDEDQGATHTNFKLDASGDELGLFDSDVAGNRVVDQVVFGELGADVSYCRVVDGSGELETCERPTPGAANGNKPRTSGVRVRPR